MTERRFPPPWSIEETGACFIVKDAQGQALAYFWDNFRKRTGAQAMMRGVNAAVVGLLGAALYNPVWTSSVNTPSDFGIALVGFVLLTVWRAPPLLVVVISALGGIGLALA